MSASETTIQRCEARLTTIPEMLAEFLRVGGFRQMAEDVLNETEPARLRIYARCVLKNCVPDDMRRAVHSRFAMLRLV